MTHTKIIRKPMSDVSTASTSSGSEATAPSKNSNLKGHTKTTHKVSTLGITLSILSLALIFMAQYFYREPLFSISLSMIETLQHKGKGTLLTVASKAISTFLGGEVMMVLVYVIA